MRLSDGVYGSFSVAAQGIVAHETGHAVQDKENYAYLKLRARSSRRSISARTSAGSCLLMGILTGAIGLAWLGVALFWLGTVFALVTLPSSSMRRTGR